MNIVAKKHIGYIDSIKGLAAIMVFLGHIMLAFPLLFFLKDIPVVKEFVNGLFPVHLFILLSGFSLCCSLHNEDLQRSITTLVVKRYFRFVVPLAIPTILAFVMCNCELGGNQKWGIYIQSEWMKAFLPPYASLKDLYHSLFYAPVMITPLINPLWMLKYIFVGSFLVTPFYMGTRTITNRCVKYSFILLFMVLLSKVTIFLTTMLAGVLVYCIYQEGIRSALLAIVCLAIFCGLTLISFGNIDSLRAIVFVLSFSIFPKLQAVFENRLLLWLGSISFEIYILHSMIIAVIGCNMALCMNYTLPNVCLILISCITAVLISATLLRKVDSLLNVQMTLLLDKTIKL